MARFAMMVSTVCPTSRAEVSSQNGGPVVAVGDHRVAQVVERHQRDPKQFGIAEAYAAIVELLRKR